MENNSSKNEQSDSIFKINVNLPVAAVIHNQTNVKSSASGNIAKDSVTKQTPVKSEENSKDLLFHTPTSVKDYSYEIKKHKKHIIFIQQSLKKKNINFQKFIQKSPRIHSVYPNVVILDKLKIDTKKCKTPTPKRRGRKKENKINKLKDNFQGYNLFDRCEKEPIAELNLNNINEWESTNGISSKTKEKLRKEKRNYFNEDWIESLLSNKRKKKNGKNKDMKNKKRKEANGFQFLNENFINSDFSSSFDDNNAKNNF